MLLKFSDFVYPQNISCICLSTNIWNAKPTFITGIQQNCIESNEFVASIFFSLKQNVYHKYSFYIKD